MFTMYDLKTKRVQTFRKTTIFSFLFLPVTKYLLSVRPVMLHSRLLSCFCSCCICADDEDHRAGRYMKKYMNKNLYFEGKTRESCFHCVTTRKCYQLRQLFGQRAYSQSFFEDVCSLTSSLKDFTFSNKHIFMHLLSNQGKKNTENRQNTETSCPCYMHRVN